MAQPNGVSIRRTDKKGSAEDLPEEVKRMLKLVVTPSGALPQLPLSNDVSEDYVNCISTRGLTFHILEAGYNAKRPLVLLLHGFPELAYSWRKVMPVLASANNYVVAVDQRGYGRTVGWDDRPYEEVDLGQFTPEQYVRDVVALVNALGYKSVRCIVGHGFGARIAALCSMMIPDVFESCVMISEPFKIVPENPLDTYTAINTGQTPIATLAQGKVFDRPRLDPKSGRLTDTDEDEVHHILRHLDPPRKYYRKYNASLEAAYHYNYPPQGLEAFLRGFFHLKSANSIVNRPRPMTSWTAFELEKLPMYYTMPLRLTMPQTIEAEMETEDSEASRDWLTDQDVKFYAQEWARTGFQGALNSFRVAEDHTLSGELVHFAGIKIKVPSSYISGNCDWGSFEDPDVLQAMPKTCSDFRGIRIVRDAGHWPHEEQPGSLAGEILQFIWKSSSPKSTAPTRKISEPPTKSLKKVAEESEPHTDTRYTSHPRHPSANAPSDRSTAGQMQARSATPEPARRGRSRGANAGHGLASSAPDKARAATTNVPVRQLGLDRSGSAAPDPESQDRRQGPGSTTSTTAEQGSTNGGRTREPSASRSHSVDVLTSRKPRSDTPAEGALMGTSRASEVVTGSGLTPIADSPIPELASESMLFNPNPFVRDIEPPPRPASKTKHRLKPQRSQSDAATTLSAEAAAPTTRRDKTILIDPKKAQARRSQPEQPSPDSASVAAENARVYKQVQEKSWDILREAERARERSVASNSRRMQEPTSTIASASADERRRRLSRGPGRSRTRSASAGPSYRSREQEAEELKRQERERLRQKEFDLRTHPGTAVAERDIFPDVPPGLR